MRRSACVAILLTAGLTAACADDGPAAPAPVAAPVGDPTPARGPVTATTDAAPATAASPPSLAAREPRGDRAPSGPPPASRAPASTVHRTTTTSEPRPEVPTGVFVAVINQNRPDVSANRFQVKLVNGTPERFRVASVQLAWDGITTEAVVRDPITTVVAGQRVDIPVPFPGAVCSGDGTRATMPAFDDARVVLGLEDGSTLAIPVVDEWFVARRLYEDDCERQLIESLVTIEWVGLHEADHERRPVTVADLRITRGAGVGEFVIAEVGNTIPFVVDPVEPGPPVLTLPAGAVSASVPVRFLESRCDPHALAEITQPTKFVAQLWFPDGTTHAYVVFPERDLWPQMRATADKACVALGLVEQLGEG